MTDRPTYTIVPATPGQEAVVIDVCLDDERPDEGCVSVDRYPVVAWRVPDDPWFSAKPVLPIVGDRVAHLVLGEDSFVDPFLETTASLERLKRYWLRQAQEKWDADHASGAA